MLFVATEATTSRKEKSMTKKNLLRGLATFAFILAVGAFAVQGVETRAEEALPEGQTRVMLEVTGMTCGSCCTKVETAVKDLDGVVSASADYEKGIATIVYVSETITVETIVETINEETSFKASVPTKNT